LPQSSESCLIQDEPITILVADDGYTDSTSEQVANRFLMVQVIRHPTPLGIVPVRNDVTNKVTIPFACTLHDDAVFTTPTIVRTTLAQFDHPRVAVVTVPLVNFINGERSNTPNRQTDPSKPFVSPHFPRGPNCIKLSAFQAVGGYRGLFVRLGEEASLPCGRCARAGSRALAPPTRYTIFIALARP